MSTLMESIKDTIHFPDDFEEFRARAASGGSLYGLFRRQAIASGILSGPPELGKDGKPLFKRQRSRSLIPRSTALAEEKSILLALYDYAEAKRYNTYNNEPRRYSTAVDGRDVDLRRVLLAKSINANIDKLGDSKSASSGNDPGGTLTLPGQSCNTLTVPGQACNVLTVPGQTCNILSVPGQSTNTLTATGQSTRTSQENTSNQLQPPGLNLTSPTNTSLLTAPTPHTILKLPGQSCNILNVPGQTLDAKTGQYPPAERRISFSDEVSISPPPIIRSSDARPPLPGSSPRTGPGVAVPAAPVLSIVPPSPSSEEMPLIPGLAVPEPQTTPTLPNMSGLSITIPGEEAPSLMDTPPESPPVSPHKGPTLRIPTQSISIPQAPGHLGPPQSPLIIPPQSPGFTFPTPNFSPPSKERRPSKFELMTTPPKITVTRKCSLPMINITDDNDELVDADMDCLAPPGPPPPGSIPMQRRRSFTITSDGIKNEGDQIMPTFPFLQQILPVEPEPEPPEERSRTSSFTSQTSTSGTESLETPVYRILMLGGPEVGKTAITQQFMTSEYMAAQNTSFDDGMECSVPVLLDGEESIMEFIDLPYTGEMNVWREYDVDAYVIVYSITDRRSYQKAVDLMFEMRKVCEVITAIILVANKADLVRARTVTEEEAADVADAYETKYIEVSAILNHKVDDLLVGTLKQIRLTLEQPELTKRRMSMKEDLLQGNGYEGCLTKARDNVLGRLLRGAKRMSKSCENLLTL